MSTENIHFSKYQGCGNHFVIIKNPGCPAEVLSIFSKSISSVQFGIGSDGLMIVRKPEMDGTVPVLMFNPDGSKMGMCGNGIRCVAKFCYDEGLVGRDIKKIVFDVHSKKIICKSADQGSNVTVNMGPAEFSFLDKTIEVNGRKIRGTALALGNPHCVVFDEEPDISFMKLLETHPIFPDRANIEFVQTISREKLKVVVWERGAGQTLACGTGACAVACAAFKLGRADSIVEIELPGGILKVTVDPEYRDILLEGPAEFIFRGEIPFHG